MSIKNLIKQNLESLVATDTSSSKLFIEAINHFKGCVSHESTLKGLKDIVVETAEELKLPKSFVTRCNNVLSLASKSSEYNLHTLDGKSNITKLYFYNIEKAISLLDYLRENDAESVNKVKNTLNKVKKVACKKTYNDDYAGVLKVLYKEYKVALGSEGEMIKVATDEAGIEMYLSKCFEAGTLELLIKKAEVLSKKMAKDTADVEEVA